MYPSFLDIFLWRHTSHFQALFLFIYFSFLSLYFVLYLSSYLSIYLTAFLNHYLFVLSINDKESIYIFLALIYLYIVDFGEWNPTNLIWVFPISSLHLIQAYVFLIIHLYICPFFYLSFTIHMSIFIFLNIYQFYLLNFRFKYTLSIIRLIWFDFRFIVLPINYPSIRLFNLSIYLYRCWSVNESIPKDLSIFIFLNIYQFYLLNFRFK